MPAKHSIQIPGVLLDAIEDDEKYDGDERFKRRKVNRGGKSVLNRKARRKQERKQKKHKREVKEVEEEEGESEDASSVMEKLAEKKGKKTTKKVEEEAPQWNQPEDEEDDLRYYAKKLHIDPKKGIHKTDEYDIVGGLFDGLDFMDKYGEGEDVGEGEGEEDSEDEEISEELDEGEDEEDDEDSDEPRFSEPVDDETEYYAKKLGISSKKKLSKEYEGDEVAELLDGLEGGDEEDEDEDDEGEDSEDSDLDSDSDSEPHQKENPYVAPVSAGKYIPPALRRKMLEESNQDSAEMQAIRRAVKGPLNKLSTPNMLTCVNELAQLYGDHPRQLVNEAILKVVLESVAVSTPMLESFLILYASAIAALYRIQGVDFGAYALQTLVEKLNTYFEGAEVSSNEAINMIGLLGFCYGFDIMSSSLMYGIIREKLLRNPSELKTTMLLKLIRSCGSKLRSEDSDSLKEIVLELNQSIKEAKGEPSTRMRFLVETITNLKNNRMKVSQNSGDLLVSAKKQLSRMENGRTMDPIQVKLEDIEHVKERGKWWLTGSAWKGVEKTEKAGVETSETSLVSDDDNLGAQTDWLEIAKQQRMNTDVRRAIFVSIMSADDYMDAFTKLDKLRLKKSQRGEIPGIIMHCVSIESVFNPFYVFLARKLCADHSQRRNFQLGLWDLLKEMDHDESGGTSLLLGEDEGTILTKELNLGRFFGWLLAEGGESLNVLRTVNFLAASSDVKMFMEILMITFLDNVGKKSEVKAFGAGLADKGTKARDLKFSEKLMVERVAKCREQPLLLKGLRYFVTNNVRESSFVKGKKQRTRVNWGVDALCSTIEEIIDEEKEI